MCIARRQMLFSSASLLGYLSISRLGLAQAAAAAVGPASDASVPPPGTAAAKTLYSDIGESSWMELNHRLRDVNDDVQAHGLRHIPCVEGTFLTVYPYNEFYDWDLYF